MTAIWKSYQLVLRTHPRLAQALNTSVLFGSGDVIAQLFLERRSLRTYDARRTSRYTGVGLLVAGPAMYAWYTRLDRIVKGTKSLAVIKKVALDQVLFLPVYLASFISLMSILRGERASRLRGQLRRDFGSLLVTSYKIWPLVQTINFYLVPLHHRILVMNCVSIAWNTYLGWRTER
ncbi:hypothetical protein LSH36_814g00016 [Paralvinella palmiformis]|uniref:Mitochondrial inner membrane protein Mpv17 n=1 Tax=Paralvinella palmiformis TaxID=53620 RepID=A0AAD9J016_9ANNE|nr:hypothetical protein LSH36_814g00016 [Paralvinella palmiformis]